jgi:uncharacterized coiled-coil protein SlyX
MERINIDETTRRVLMTHFRFYENTAPFPGTCVFSGENKNLWEIGSMTVQGQVLPVLLSDRVLIELAIQAGFVTSKSFAELNAALTEKIDKQQAQLDELPSLLKEFQNDITGTITNFVTSLASVTVANKPVQPKGSKAKSGSAEASAGQPDQD